MIHLFEKIQNDISNHNLPISNEKLKLIIEEYSFHYVSEKNYLNTNSDILNKIKESKIITIYRFNQENLGYFIIGFEKTIIIIQQSSLSFLKNLFINTSDLNIYFFPNSKSVFDEKININYIQAKHIFDCDKNNQYIKSTCDNIILKPIVSSILQYLVEKSYHKMSMKNRIKKDCYCNSKEVRKFNENEYFEMDTISSGSSFRARAIYIFDKEEIFVIKESCVDNNDEESKLIQRELDNYKQINHPLVPKFYGTTTNNSVVIEYIKGETLLRFDMNKLTEREKLTIIYEIMITIGYFHKNKMILRDLKPDNIMIDHNKTAVFIDFDRVLNHDNIVDLEKTTKNFGSVFIAPEVGSKPFSYECDLYSLGKIIYFLIIQKIPNDKNIQNFNDFGKHSTLKEIFEICTEIEPKKRKNIFDIINIFFKQYSEQINDQMELTEIFIEYAVICNNPVKIFNFGKLYYHAFINQNIQKYIYKAIHYYTVAADMNYPDAQYNLGVIYENGNYVEKNYNKAIHYYKLAAQQNCADAQVKLGMIYIKSDTNLAIHYFKLAAKQNHQTALINLGVIYYEGNYVTLNITKSIKYFTKAADQQNAEAQYMLGIIYENLKDFDKMIYYYTKAADNNYTDAQNNLAIIYHDGEYVKTDINKAIHYYKLAADNNNPNSQYNLGLFYYNGQYIKRNIEAALHYWQLASNQNFPNAHLNLGCIYYKNEYVPRDINKSIYYFTLAAKQNVIKAQYILGMIYLLGQYVKRNIKKSIYFFEKAAYQNDSESQYILGNIYNDGKYVERNIDKAISFFTLAANQNNSKAQFNLGIIYKEKNLIMKSIHYFSLAANLNDAEAQFSLGLIYHEGNGIKQDINKAIYYYSLAAKQNHPRAEFNLGSIYLLNEYIPRDIKKAIHYYSLASDHNHSYAQNNLGNIYFEGQLVPIDINKSIHYFTLAANQNHPGAKLMLGILYILGFYVDKNVDKGIDYLMQATKKNKNFFGNFMIGFYFHDKNIEKAISFYKEASTYKSIHAKNNLGIIYKNGVEQIKKNIGVALSYFEDLINIDIVSMYNLAHIYVYEDKNNDRIDISINLLIKSLNKNFLPAKDLLCIALIKKCGFDIENIQNVLQETFHQTNDFVLSISDIIINEKLLEKTFYEEKYEYYKTIDFLYDYTKTPILSKNLNKDEYNPIINMSLNNNMADFYEGFGF